MPRFRAHLCFTIFLVAAAIPTASEQLERNSDAATAQSLQSIERAWLDAEKNHDAAAFEKFVADDWIALTPDGKTQTKTERAAEIKAAHITSATMGDMKVRIFGDTAVVTGSDDEVNEESGKTFSFHYVWTDVFVKRQGEWLAVASQTAEIK
jgi:ketosteroid isomerase-like protein